ncbi:TetR/AcrR family transcriptional regulator [Agrococcus sp. SGAir0287]|uniref:TetR/AcrR family transcriptional regulator n=1 Tax=Agrococcus sp. SGAir0287 TaxID=2070347 RepID=UPI0010CD28FF|nr:TetR-like C-terminal domain-containing protein [Agrococcus sp. SGAir0287]QCR19995.1 TetR family transcriptional regulator [Agrococcus sp. SGAir0287]
MPAPERTTTDAVIAAGRAIVEEGGAAALTMQAVAERVGVRAPSLYKRVAGRDALLAAVVAATLDELASELAAAADAGTDARGRLVAIAEATRAFARRAPVGYGLVFGPPSPQAPDPAALATAADPLLAATRELVGDEDALDAARLLTAWLHGFLAMDLAGAFRLGGDVDAAFAYGLDRILAAIEP